MRPPGPASHLTTQREALRALGVDGALPSTARAASDPMGYLRAVSAASHAGELLDRSGLGAFRWLVQSTSPDRPAPTPASPPRVTTQAPSATDARADWTASPHVGNPGPVPHPRRVAAALLASAALTAALSGCGGADGASPRTTVTVTTSNTPTSSATAAPTATTDVKGRHFDVGTVTDVSTVGGVTVIELDRWTLPGTSDTDVARNGIKVVPHRDARYTNQNTEKTYTAPVADGAIAVVNRCVPGSGGELGLESTPQSASTLAGEPRQPRRAGRHLRRPGPRHPARHRPSLLVTAQPRSGTDS